MTSTSYTPSQIKAIQHDRGNLVLFAVAGSGKTTVLVQRIKRLAALEKKQLVLTFSKKAATSLVHRVGRTPDKSFIGTFHSFCFNAIRRRRPDLYKGRELLQSREEWLLVSWAEDLLKHARGNMAPADLIRLMGRFKTYGYHPSTWGDNQEQLRKLGDGIGPYEVALASDLNDRLEQSGKFTFDDMLVDTLRELDSDPVFGRLLREFFDYVMVDEFQDTDPCQARILQHVSSENLCVVGDDDQAIYAFRGCSPSFIMDFETHYPGACTKISMEDNFRSEDQILEHANMLIKNNTNRVAKTLVTTKGSTGAVAATQVLDSVQEARFVADLVEEHHASGISYKEIAVLYRTNAQSGALEDEFAERQLPFEVADDDGGFYSRTEIKTLVNYLRILKDPKDTSALRWVLNRPTRFIRREWLASSVQRGPNAVVDTLRAMRSKGSVRQQDAIIDMANNLGYLIDLARSGTGPSQLVGALWQWLGYESYLNELSSRSVKRNVDEYVDSTMRFVQQTVPRFTDLGSLLNHIDLVEAENRKKREDRDAVLFTTIHRAKGLEFPVVVIVGFNQELLPHKDAPVDEERRLAYVAVTRAIKTLHITTYGQPSKFFKELGLTIDIREDIDEQLQHSDPACELLGPARGMARVPQDGLDT
jgi:DNA helicase II / ATP-dependent DNA helicase PcrA